MRAPSALAEYFAYPADGEDKGSRSQRPYAVSPTRFPSARPCGQVGRSHRVYVGDRLAELTAGAAGEPRRTNTEVTLWTSMDRIGSPVRMMVGIGRLSVLRSFDRWCALGS